MPFVCFVAARLIKLNLAQKNVMLTPFVTARSNDRNAVIQWFGFCLLSTAFCVTFSSISCAY